MTSIQTTAEQVMNMLRNNKRLSKNATVQLCIKLLEDCKDEARLHNTNVEALYDLAAQSGKSEFKIIARMNDDGPGYHVFGEWADEANNFAFMCTNELDDQEHKDGIYLKRTYTLSELPQALKNAEAWQKSVKQWKNFWTETLHVLAVK